MSQVRERGFSILVVEVDAAWSFSRSWGVSDVDQLTWLAYKHGYHPYFKVPCAARPGETSHTDLEAGFASSYHSLLNAHGEFVPTMYHTKGTRGSCKQPLASPALAPSFAQRSHRAAYSLRDEIRWPGFDNVTPRCRRGHSRPHPARQSKARTRQARRSRQRAMPTRAVARAGVTAVALRTPRQLGIARVAK